MSADACVVYYGLCFEIGENEIEDCERRRDSRIIAARSSHLNYYWADFGMSDERNMIFVGTEIGVFGPENLLEVRLSRLDMQQIQQQTEEKLGRSGLQGEPKLLVQWLVDK